MNNGNFRLYSFWPSSTALFCPLIVLPDFEHAGANDGMKTSCAEPTMDEAVVEELRR